MNQPVGVSAAAFFPWVSLIEPLRIGQSIRLLPYRTGKLPGPLPFADQDDIDRIFSAYSNRRNIGVAGATLLEVDEWNTGMEDINIRKRLLRARAVIGFAALAKRRLFEGHFGYCCYDAYSLVVQRFRRGAAGDFAFTTRRRDGGLMSYWGADDFAFQRPVHVDSRAQFDVDLDLARCLMDLPRDASSEILEAISEFNSANTDSADILEHVELVMTKSAFEWLLGISEKSTEFVRSLEESFRGLNHEIPKDGPLRSAWEVRFPKARTALEAWAREFCDLRGASAHGKNRRAPRFVWRPRAHLAFASILFPLLVKKRLADAGHWRLAEIDAQKLRQIESYLMDDPFLHDPASRDSNPWSELDSLALTVAIAAKWKK